MYNEMDIDRIRGAVAYDRNGDRIGNVGEVYLDDQSGQPMWVTVNTGFFGLRTSFAPLDGSRFEDDGRLVLAHDKDRVKDAPNVDEDGHLDRAQEDELYSYYGVGAGGLGGELADDQLRTRRWQDEGREDGPLFDRDRDGRGPVGEVLDGPDGSPSDRRGDVGLDPHADRDRGLDGDRLPEDYDRDRASDDGPLLDSDRDGRGPVREVLDGPDDPANPRRN